MKLKLENKTPLFIGLGIFFILMLDYAFLLRPQILLIKKIGGQVSFLSKELRSAKKDIASIEQFKKRLATLKENIAVVGERIPAEEEIPVALENISQLAKDSYVKIIQIKPSRESEKNVATLSGGKVFELPIFIEARCGFHQLGSFLNKLESDKIFMNIDGFELLPNPEDNLHHIAKLVVEIYILKK